MSLLFSPSTGGFYEKALSKKVPADAVAISKSLHAEMLAAQAAGATIVGHPATGQPMALAKSAEELRSRTVRAIRREAERRIIAVSPLWRQLNDQREPSEGAASRFAAIDAIRAGSGAIEALLAETADADLAAFPVADNPLWPAIEEPA